MTSDWAAFNDTNPGSGDQVIYYRKPNKGGQPRWITHNDSASGTKLRDFIHRGFEPLMKYGVINSAHREIRAFGAKGSPADPTMTKERYVWEGILSHPDGPAEFPLSQVIAFRWYRPENCPVPEAYFPQLEGKKVKEYTCPERCGRPPFVSVDGAGGVTPMRKHLRIMHDWTQVELEAYGKRVGIDWDKADIEDLAIREIEFGSPSQAVLTCERCGEEFKGGMAAARLQKHKNNHPVAEIVTV